MAEKYTIKQAGLLIKAARKSISYYLASGKIMVEPAPEQWMNEKRGLFVTLNTFPEGELRGCIGFPYPSHPIWEAVIEAAAAAAFSDPRFPPLQASELDKIAIEISLLTPPEPVTGSKEELPDKIKIGEDGLIVKKGARSGLLLPQVAAELRYDAETFLQHTCRKASLPSVMWKEKDCQVYKFQAQIFKEDEPSGMVSEEKLLR